MQPSGAATTIIRWGRTAIDYWGGVFSGDRNLDGTFTEEGKAKIVEANVPAVVQASGGTMSAGEAREVLDGDITQVLIDNKADPSQTGTLGTFGLIPDWMPWAAAGVGAVVLLSVVRR